MVDALLANSALKPVVPPAVYPLYLRANPALAGMPVIRAYSLSVLCVVVPPAVEQAGRSLGHRERPHYPVRLKQVELLPQHLVY